jgi:hypothetical protein
MAKRKEEPEELPLEPIRAGERCRLNCLDCSTEYDLVLEPKARPGSKEAEDIAPQVPKLCPFCGSEYVEQG